MQHMIRWQVEAVKSEITGAVFGFRIVTLKWERKDTNSAWDKIIPDEVEENYSFAPHGTDYLSRKEYFKLLKLFFIQAFKFMNRLASLFCEIIVDDSGISNFEQTVGLNWIQITYDKKEDSNELDRRTSDENRVSDDSEITRHC